MIHWKFNTEFFQFFCCCGKAHRRQQEDKVSIEQHGLVEGEQRRLDALQRVGLPANHRRYVDAAVVTGEDDGPHLRAEGKK